MADINHINLTNSEGQVYCRKRNKVVVLDGRHTQEYCNKCPMFQGSAQGEGVECRWNDLRALQDPTLVIDPQQEKNQVLIADETAVKETITVKEK